MRLILKKWVLPVLVMVVTLQGCQMTENHDAKDVHEKVLSLLKSHDDSVSIFKPQMREWKQLDELREKGRFIAARSDVPRSARLDAGGVSYTAFYEMEGRVYEVPLYLEHDTPYTTVLCIFAIDEVTDPHALIVIKHF